MSRTDEYSRLCSTAKGRKALVARIEALAALHGATVQMHEFNAEREIGLDIHFGPYRCMMHFEGGSNVGAFLGHWHVDHKSLATYPVTFAADIRGTMNTYHYSKATTCSDTLEAFTLSLANGLDSLKIEMEEDAA